MDLASLIISIAGMVITVASTGVAIWQARKAKGYADGLREARDEIQRLQTAATLGVLCASGRNAIAFSADLSPGMGRQARGFQRSTMLRAIQAYRDDLLTRLHLVPDADREQLRHRADEIGHQLQALGGNPAGAAHAQLHRAVVASVEILQRVIDGAAAAPPPPAVPGGGAPPRLLPE